MIQQIKNIECEYCGLIAHQVVAYQLFEENQEEAIEYLNSLVENGILKYLNGQFPDNQYYRFIDDSYVVDCDNCQNKNCDKLEVVNG